jgi:hypothetical protein
MLDRLNKNKLELEIFKANLKNLIFYSFCSITIKEDSDIQILMCQNSHANFLPSDILYVLHTYTLYLY